MKVDIYKVVNKGYQTNKRTYVLIHHGLTTNILPDKIISEGNLVKEKVIDLNEEGLYIGLKNTSEAVRNIVSYGYYRTEVFL